MRQLATEKERKRIDEAKRLIKSDSDSFKVSSDRGKLNRAFKDKYKKTIYQVLGVKARVPEKEMKEVARKLRLKNHPDRGGSADKFAMINEAIEIMLKTYA